MSNFSWHCVGVGRLRSRVSAMHACVCVLGIIWRPRKLASAVTFINDSQRCLYFPPAALYAYFRWTGSASAPDPLVDIVGAHFPNVLLAGWLAALETTLWSVGVMSPKCVAEIAPWHDESHDANAHVVCVSPPNGFAWLPGIHCEFTLCGWCRPAPAAASVSTAAALAAAGEMASRAGVTSFSVCVCESSHVFACSEHVV